VVVVVEEEVQVRTRAAPLVALLQQLHPLSWSSTVRRRLSDEVLEDINYSELEWGWDDLTINKIYFFFFFFYKKYFPPHKRQHNVFHCC